MTDEEYIAQAYADLDHSREMWADYVALAGLPVHPTAPGTYEMWNRLVANPEQICGCLECFNKRVPGRRRASR